MRRKYLIVALVLVSSHCAAQYNSDSDSAYIDVNGDGHAELVKFSSGLGLIEVDFNGDSSWHIGRHPLLDGRGLVYWPYYFSQEICRDTAMIGKIIRIVRPWMKLRSNPDPSLQWLFEFETGGFTDSSCSFCEKVYQMQTNWTRGEPPEKIFYMMIVPEEFTELKYRDTSALSEFEPFSKQDLEAVVYRPKPTIHDSVFYDDGEIRLFNQDNVLYIQRRDSFRVAFVDGFQRWTDGYGWPWEESYNQVMKWNDLILIFKTNSWDIGTLYVMHIDSSKMVRIKTPEWDETDGWSRKIRMNYISIEGHNVILFSVNGQRAVSLIDLDDYLKSQ